MLKNYLKTTLTYLWNHKSFSIINLIGLTSGITACFFTLVYVNFELSYDSYHINADNIYRFVTDVKTASGIDYRTSSAPMAPAVKEAFPEVKAAARFYLDHLVVQREEISFSEEKIAYADSTLFSVFTFPLVSGVPSKVLNAPFNVVLTETCVRKYFGAEDPVGKTLIINGKDKGCISGIMKDIPHNSHFRVDMLVSLSTLFKVADPLIEDDWSRLGCYTYLLLSENCNPSQLSAKLPDLIMPHLDQSRAEYIFSLEPLKDVYLHGKSRGRRSGSSISGNINNVYIFSLVAVFVLFIACFNFMNLTTAFSMHRAKEVGIRKIFGASRKQLIIQFLSDAILLSITAFVFSLILIALLWPFFNELSGKIVSQGLSGQLTYIGWLLLLSIGLGLLSGISPAIFISGLKSIRQPKSRFTSSRTGGLRKTLVIAQFSISTILVVGTIVIFNQLHFMRNQPLGFKKDHMLVIDFQFDKRVSEHLESIKHELKTLSGITAVSTSSAIPGRPNHKLDTRIENFHSDMDVARYDAYFVDSDFMNQYEIKVIAGKQFTDKIQSYADPENIEMLINEAAVKRLGYFNPEDIIGKTIAQWGNKGMVTGVVKDFHFQSFREEVQPLTFQQGNKDMLTFMTISLSTDNLPATLGALERKWKKTVPGLPMAYFFADDAFNAQYIAEKRFRNLFISFALLAIIISSLGLFGLSAFSITQRTKEIGIRKVLGSSVVEVVNLLVKDFLSPVIIAFIIAIPVSGYLMSKWLEEFAYRINISYGVFIQACLMVVFVAFTTICFRTIKAAKANPVKSIRIE